MTDTENTPAKPKKAQPAQTDTIAAAPAPVYVTQPTQGVGRGILIGAIAASLVGGLALGGIGGFAIASATHQPPAFAQTGQNQQNGPQGQGQHGPGQGMGQGWNQGGMPGQPPQGGPQGGGQQGGPQMPPHDQSPQDDGDGDTDAGTGDSDSAN
jgi:hypothetical protein